MSSKVSQDTLYEVVQEDPAWGPSASAPSFWRLESQISLMNYDPQDKCFLGTIRLKSTPCSKFSVCVLGKRQHCNESKAVNIPHMDIEVLKTLKQNKKLVKKLAKK